MTSPRERAQLQLALRQQQQALVRDLLPVLDALDRAESHWRQSPPPQRPAGAEQRRGLWGRLRSFWSSWWRWRRVRPTPADQGEGIRLIRAQLLEALQRHGLEPFASVGELFDPQCMQALGQRPAIAAGTAPGLVVEEAVRGYRWQGKLLREAQVLVAGP